jgi:hypothetical protein
MSNKPRDPRRDLSAAKKSVPAKPRPNVPSFNGILGHHHVGETLVTIADWGKHKAKRLVVFACKSISGIGARKGKKKRSAMLPRGSAHVTSKVTQ